MSWWPRSLEEARAMRYGSWAGNERGHAYQPQRCAAEVYPGGGMIQAQCRRKNGHGQAGLYCKQHGRILAEGYQ